MNYNRLGDMDMGEDIPMQAKVVGRPKFRNTLEAQIQEGDSLQAIAIRYNCSVSEQTPLASAHCPIECS